MAFVGISQNLMGDVRNKIRTMCLAEVQSLGEDPMRAFTMTGYESWFLDQLWGQHLHLRDQIPERWFRKFDNVDVHFNFNWNGDPAALRNYNTYIRINAKGIMFPPDIHGSDVYLGFTPDAELPPELAKVVHFSHQKKQIEKRWDDVRSKVCGFLETCKSLNEAIKLWPDLRMYIPSDYLERLDKKPERSTSTSKALDVLATINTDEIAAAAVIARMSGAEV